MLNVTPVFSSLESSAGTVRPNCAILMSYLQIKNIIWLHFHKDFLFKE